MHPIIYPEDAAYLVRAVAQECEAHDLPYAALVGIAAVVLNRTEDERYPDTAAAVIDTWEVFRPVSAPPPAESAELTEFAELTELTEDDPILRLCTDACAAAAAGADPTGGSLNFAVLDPALVHDSPFYTLLIDNVAFW